MSLRALSEQVNQEQDQSFVAQTAELAASDVAPAEPEGIVDRHKNLLRRAEQGANPVAAEADKTGPEQPLSEAGPAEEPRASAAPAEPELQEPADQATVEASDQDPIDPASALEPAAASPEAPASSDVPDQTAADQGVTVPDGIPDGSIGVRMTDQDRIAALAGEKTRGSISDGGSVEEMLANLPARPAVSSQREIQEYNRRRLGDLEIRRPTNWPEFMTFPSDTELRALRREGVTLDMVKDFEASKQRQADEMEARAAEINAWIFASGDMRLNEKHQMARSRNRDEAVRKRSEPISRSDDDLPAPRPEDVTDEELYKDRHYGIRFAMLLNPEPDHLNMLRKAPVAAWGHDMIRTLDGGRIRATGEEIRVTTVSLQAAQMMVMEAKARGWETLRISGDNEFCAAIKRACKEQGMGAIISRRGPLGLGPFSRPEVIMPPIPDSLNALKTAPSEPQRKQKEEAAPKADRDAAADLLGEGPAPASKPKEASAQDELDRISVEDPLISKDPDEPAPDGPEPR